MRDQAVRVQAGISLLRAAKIAGVNHQTLRLYEVDPMAVRNPQKRDACAGFYVRLRTFLGDQAAA